MSTTLPAYKNSEIPMVHIKNIEFNDNTPLTLEKNSIVVFTGPNNCGKSQVLKDIDNWFPKQTIKTISNMKFDVVGTLEDVFIDKHFYEDAHGTLQSYEKFSVAMRNETIKYHWKRKTLGDYVDKIFIKRISTENRITTSNPLNRSHDHQKHPIYRIVNDSALAEQISSHFKKAFNVDLVMNQNNMNSIPLHVGNAPDKNAFTIAEKDNYYKEIGELDLLSEQGDGMRSFASLLLDTFTSDHTITLIDEPEAFLHPPQARIMGMLLTKNNPDTRQMLIATHSEDFLQGLLDANRENIIVIRINRVENTNHMSILNNSDIKTLWNNPILKYSNILSGLFHEKVVVCESDYDCLFYQAVINAIFEAKDEIPPDILFTHCGGKGRMKDIVRALHSVKVPIVAIPDFDIIDKSTEFKSLTNSFGIDWDDLPTQTVYDYLNAHKDIKKNIKLLGKHALDGVAAESYDTIEKICCDSGLFIVPCGEMECFHKNNFSKAEWVYNELENSNLATDPHLQSAREFLTDIVTY